MVLRWRFKLLLADPPQPDAAAAAAAAKTFGRNRFNSDGLPTIDFISFHKPIKREEEKEKIEIKPLH